MKNQTKALTIEQHRLNTLAAQNCNVRLLIEVFGLEAETSDQGGQFFSRGQNVHLKTAADKSKGSDSDSDRRQLALFEVESL